MKIVHKKTGDEYKLIGLLNHGKKGSGKGPVLAYQCVNTGELYWRTEEEMRESFTLNHLDSER